MAKSRYLSIIAVVVESGAILTISTTFLLAFVDHKAQAGAILAGMATQIAVIKYIVLPVNLADISFLDNHSNTHHNSNWADQKLQFDW